MAAMTDDCVFENTSPPHGQRYEGQAQVRAAWEEFFAASPHAHFDGEDVIVAGDRASCSGPTRGPTTTARTSALRGVDVLRVRDGKVAEKFAYVKG